MDLYALAPEEFTAARDEQVRQARKQGDRERAAQLAALRRPTGSAHAVNALVRAEPALVEQLLELGAQLAAAQAGGQGEALRQLGGQRRQLVEAVADRAAAATGAALSPAVRTEVVATLEAALADPPSAEAVRSGRLVRALSYAGFGGVDLEGAVARPLQEAPSPPPQADRRRGRTRVVHPAEDARAERAREERARAAEAARRARVERAQQAALDAAGLLDDAVRAAQAAEAERERRVAQSTEAAEQVADAEHRLAEARERRVEAEAAERRTVRELDRAYATVRAAQEAAERARAALDRLDDRSDTAGSED